MLALLYGCLGTIVVRKAGATMRLFSARPLHTCLLSRFSTSQQNSFLSSCTTEFASAFLRLVRSILHLAALIAPDHGSQGV